MVRRRNAHGSTRLVSVRPAALGMGVFASQPIRRRQTVGEIKGLLIRDPRYSSEYCVNLDAGNVLEPDAPFRYLNHSCDPNCELFSLEGPDDERLWLAALSDIAPGEELTIDYAWPLEGAIPCECRSPLCRGWIVCREELPRLLEMVEQGRL